MNKILWIILLVAVYPLLGLEKDLEKAPILPKGNSSYTPFINRVSSPEPYLEQPTQELKRRRTTLWNAISIKDVRLAKASLEKDFEWVNKLYIHNRFENNQIAKTTHDELQHKLRFTRQLFAEIDSAIAKEEARQEWLRKLSAPGSIITECCKESDCWNCCTYYPQWGNAALSILLVGITAIYCAARSPSRLSTIDDPCAILPPGQQAQMFLDCEQTSMKTSKPCVIFDPNNATQIRMLEDCCTNLVNVFCIGKVDQYNTQVYPKQLRNAWTPELIVVPSLAVLQIAFQIGGCFYRKFQRLREPIKQLIAQKKMDLDQVAQDIDKLTIVDDTSFQEL